MTIHPTAEVSPKAQIGPGTRVWHWAQIREGAVIGANCIIGKDVYVDIDVNLGDNVKVQNGALLYHGLEVESGVFIGPQVCFTNDRYPRAINSDGSLKTAIEWDVGKTVVRYGASIGAGAVIVTGVEVGRFAMVAAGAVVTRSIPDYGLVMGVPAKLVGYVCRCGHRLDIVEDVWKCPSCGWALEV